MNSWRSPQTHLSRFVASPYPVKSSAGAIRALSILQTAQSSRRGDGPPFSALCASRPRIPAVGCRLSLRSTCDAGQFIHRPTFAVPVEARGTDNATQSTPIHIEIKYSPCIDVLPPRVFHPSCGVLVVGRIVPDSDHVPDFGHCEQFTQLVVREPGWT